MTECVASAMGKDKIRYLVFLNGAWRWSPTKNMRAAGFSFVTLGPGLTLDGERVPAAEDKRRALKLNEDWDRHRKGLPPAAVDEHRYPKGSVGDGYLRAMALRENERRQKKSSGPKSSTAATIGPARGNGSAPSSVTATPRR